MNKVEAMLNKAFENIDAAVLDRNLIPIMQKHNERVEYIVESIMRNPHHPKYHGCSEDEVREGVTEGIRKELDREIVAEEKHMLKRAKTRNKNITNRLIKNNVNVEEDVKNVEIKFEDRAIIDGVIIIDFQIKDSNYRLVLTPTLSGGYNVQRLHYRVLTKFFEVA